MTASVNSLECVAFGVRFRLSADSDLELAQMLANAPLGTEVCSAATTDARRLELLRCRESLRYRLTVDNEIVADGEELQSVMDQLARILMVHVANHAPDRVFMHAGVVGWQGRALVLPGASFAGKTTLVAELVRAGAIYYSDEYAVLDENGHVHPYARDLQMRQGGRPEQTAVAVELLNGSAGTQPLPVSQVIFCQYVEQGRWLPQPMSAGMAVLEMLRHAIPVQRTPARVMSTLTKMMASATAVRSERGEASIVARALLTAGEASP
jgi:hypothetical protein